MVSKKVDNQNIKYLIMKKFFKIIFAIVLIMVLGYSCADDTLQSVAEAPAEGQFLLTNSTSEIVLAKKNADKNIAVTLNWDNKSWYGIDTPLTYTLQIDKSDGVFVSPQEMAIASGNNISLTHADLNAQAFALELKPEVASKIKVRLKANLRYGAVPIYSNVSTLTITPYSTLILKYPMPTELYLQGDAVPSNWGTPVTDIQKMTQIDDHRFGLIVALTGGKSFAAISAASTWSDPAYVTMEANASPQTSGTFEPRGSSTNWGGTPIKSPASTGVYQVIFDFTTGTYSITPSVLMTSPAELYIIGDATTNGWNAPGTGQKFTKVDAHTFTLTTTLKAGKYAFLNANATWSTPAYLGKTDAEPLLGGNLTLNQAPNWAGTSITAPNPGNYTITVNFKSGTYVLKP
ncbi:SusF/SusE family outer membrane protein [Flavobacterium nackdongense]|uniref:SusF/SusE family outer membrane protein n=2 Tax=Flavobacterium nackdongense TaxID=2547394 RepID=A0A4P6Y9C8_9FLAO|nr:SusF/SusE family outer membrane protein [Flavobacterium nackdongense]